VKTKWAAGSEEFVAKRPKEGVTKLNWAMLDFKILVAPPSTRCFTHL
jgi:hypothetical protein